MDWIKILVLAIELLFVLVAYTFRKKISYPFCPLEKYTGKTARGKSVYVGTIHTMLSFGFSVLIFALLNELPAIDAEFNNDVIRISSFIMLLMISFFFLGLLIEAYLLNTDKEYKNWKQNYLNKK